MALNGNMGPQRPHCYHVERHGWRSEDSHRFDGVHELRRVLDLEERERRGEAAPPADDGDWAFRELLRSFTP